MHRAFTLYGRYVAVGLYECRRAIRESPLQGLCFTVELCELARAGVETRPYGVCVSSGVCSDLRAGAQCTPLRVNGLLIQASYSRYLCQYIFGGRTAERGAVVYAFVEVNRLIHAFVKQITNGFVVFQRQDRKSVV